MTGASYFIEPGQTHILLPPIYYYHVLKSNGFFPSASVVLRPPSNPLQADGKAYAKVWSTRLPVSCANTIRWLIIIDCLPFAALSHPGNQVVLLVFYSRVNKLLSQGILELGVGGMPAYMPCQQVIVNSGDARQSHSVHKLSAR